MIKKIVKFFSWTLLIAVVLLITFSRFTGAGIKLPNGRHLGYSYSKNGSEWLFLEYKNIPVRQDGPYVLNKKNKRHAIYISGDGITTSKMIQKEVTTKIEVLVDNNENTKFLVPLRKNHRRSELTIPSQKKLFVISDLEGEFDVMVKLLKANNVIDDSLNWSYASGHLILVGDMVDRGVNVVPLLWLIYKLEAEAKIAGGNVHFILGNHERYLLDGRTKSVANKYFGTYRTTGMSQRELWSNNSELGRWLRSKPIMIKIGNTLFLHAGVSPKILSLDPTFQSIDKEAEKNFVTNNVIKRVIDGSVIHDANGLIFYRGLARDMSDYNLGKKASKKHVEQILKRYQVERIAIGHTVAENIGYDYDGKVIRIDVHHSGKVSEGLLIENNLLWRADDEGKKFELKQVENLYE